MAWRRIQHGRTAGPAPQAGYWTGPLTGLFLGAAAALGAPVCAAAAPVVMVTEDAVPQFRDTAEGVREILPEVVSVDIAAGDAAGQVKAQNPSVVIAVGGKAAALMKDAALSAPLVYATVLHPASKGLAGSKITGVPMEVPALHVFPRLKQLAPRVTRVGVLYDPTTSTDMVEGAVRAAADLGLAVVAKPVRDPRDLRAAAESMVATIDALWLLPDSRIMTQEVTTYLLLFASERRIPLMGFLDKMTQLGAVASFAPDFSDIGRRAGQLAKELAARPPEKRFPVPPPAFSPGALSINLRTAAQIGLSVPAGLQDAARKVVR